MNKNRKIIFACLFFTPLILSCIFYGVSEIPVSSSEKTEYKIMTYNIHFGQGMDDVLNLERLAQNILTEDPDIIGLQEVENGRITSQGVDMAYWFAKRLNMYYFYYPAVNKHAFGVALLSKYPIKSATGYDIPSLSLERPLLHGVITISSTLEIEVFVTHVGFGDENVPLQIEFIRNKINLVATATNPQILMGDFNLDISIPEDKILIDRVKLDFDDTAIVAGATKHKTHISDGTIIDYIFASGYTTVEDNHVVTDFIAGVDIPAEYGSDHLPVVCTLTFA